MDAPDYVSPFERHWNEAKNLREGWNKYDSRFAQSSLLGNNSSDRCLWPSRGSDQAWHSGQETMLGQNSATVVLPNRKVSEWRQRNNELISAENSRQDRRVTSRQNVVERSRETSSELSPPVCMAPPDILPISEQQQLFYQAVNVTNHHHNQSSKYGRRRQQTQQVKPSESPHGHNIGFTVQTKRSSREFPRNYTVSSQSPCPATSPSISERYTSNIQAAIQPTKHEHVTPVTLTLSSDTSLTPSSSYFQIRTHNVWDSVPRVTASDHVQRTGRTLIQSNGRKLTDNYSTNIQQSSQPAAYQSGLGFGFQRKGVSAIGAAVARRRLDSSGSSDRTRQFDSGRTSASSVNSILSTAATANEQKQASNSTLTRRNSDKPVLRIDCKPGAETGDYETLSRVASDVRVFNRVANSPFRMGSPPSKFGGRIENQGSRKSVAPDSKKLGTSEGYGSSSSQDMVSKRDLPIARYTGTPTSTRKDVLNCNRHGKISLRAHLAAASTQPKNSPREIYASFDAGYNFSGGTRATAASNLGRSFPIWFGDSDTASTVSDEFCVPIRNNSVAADAPLKHFMKPPGFSNPSPKQSDKGSAVVNIKLAADRANVNSNPSCVEAVSILNQEHPRFVSKSQPQEVCVTTESGFMEQSSSITEITKSVREEIADHVVSSKESEAKGETGSDGRTLQGSQNVNKQEEAKSISDDNENVEKIEKLVEETVERCQSVKVVRRMVPQKETDLDSPELQTRKESPASNTDKDASEESLVDTKHCFKNENLKEATSELMESSNRDIMNSDLVVQLFNLIGRLTDEMKRLEADCAEMKEELKCLKSEKAEQEKQHRALIEEMRQQKLLSTSQVKQQEEQTQTTECVKTDASTQSERRSVETVGEQDIDEAPLEVKEVFTEVPEEMQREVQIPIALDRIVVVSREKKKKSMREKVFGRLGGSGSTKNSLGSTKSIDIMQRSHSLSVPVKTGDKERFSFDGESCEEFSLGKAPILGRNSPQKSQDTSFETVMSGSDKTMLGLEELNSRPRALSDTTTVTSSSSAATPSPTHELGNKSKIGADVDITRPAENTIDREWKKLLDSSAHIREGLKERMGKQDKTEPSAILNNENPAIVVTKWDQGGEDEIECKEQTQLEPSVQCSSESRSDQSQNEIDGVGQAKKLNGEDGLGSCDAREASVEAPCSSNSFQDWIKKLEHSEALVLEEGPSKSPENNTNVGSGEEEKEDEPPLPPPRRRIRPPEELSFKAATDLEGAYSNWKMHKSTKAPRLSPDSGADLKVRFDVNVCEKTYFKDERPKNSDGLNLPGDHPDGTMPSPGTRRRHKLLKWASSLLSMRGGSKRAKKSAGKHKIDGELDGDYEEVASSSDVWLDEGDEQSDAFTASMQWARPQRKSEQTCRRNLELAAQSGVVNMLNTTTAATPASPEDSDSSEQTPPCPPVRVQSMIQPPVKPPPRIPGMSLVQCAPQSATPGAGDHEEEEGEVNKRSSEESSGGGYVDLSTYGVRNTKTTAIATHDDTTCRREETSCAEVVIAAVQMDSQQDGNIDKEMAPAQSQQDMKHDPDTKSRCGEREKCLRPDN